MPAQQSDMSVKSPSVVVLNISTHGMPLVQSNDVVGTNCCIISLMRTILLT